MMNRIAWFSTINGPHLSAAAAYTRLLLPCLAEFEIEIFTGESDFSDSLPLGSGQSGARVFHSHRAAQRHREHPFQYFVYNLEDRASSRPVQLAAEVVPGVAIFHDVRLNQLYRGRFSHSTAAKDIDEMQIALFGEQAARLGEYHVRGWSIESFDRVYHCGKPEAEAAGAVLTFSNAGVRRLRSLGIRAEVLLGLPPVAMVPSTEVLRQREQTRAMLQYRSEQVVIGFCGSEILVDRIPQALEAFAAVLSDGAPQIRLLWLVGSRLERERAQQALQRCSRHAPTMLEHIDLVCRESAEDYRSVLSAFDLLLAPRFDELRGVPRYVLDVSARAVPAITSSVGSGFSFPQGATLSIEPGRGEERALRMLLGESIANRALRVKVGEAARAFVAMECTAAGAAEDFRAVLERNGERIGAVQRAAQARYRHARSELLTELRQEAPFDAMHANHVVEPGGTDVINQAIHEFGWE
ncbi:MAG: hypothetical protein KDD69_10800 [Bdellovibrionales bacterium]|nr:hypothetical protein [Bdellovibrionales bacterium]